MSRFTLCCVAFGMLATVLAGDVSADVPPVIAVQGRLTDDGGTPLPAGAKSFTFRIFDNETNGTKVWPSGAGEDQNITTDAAGAWSASVGAVDALNDLVFTGTDRWLEIEVDGSVLPRLRLVTGPYAFRVSTVDGSSGGQISSVLSVPALEVGDLATSGLQEMYRSGSAVPTLVFNGGAPQGGSIHVRDETGDDIITMAPDGDGTGGYLSISRAPSIEGFYIDGNANGSGEPRVGLTGSARSLVLDMSQEGDNSVSLPPDAIAASEVVDEPGVASNDRHAEAVLTGGIDVLTSRALTAPADGYVLAIATGEVIDFHVNNTNSAAAFGISTSSTDFLAIQNITQIPSSAPTGTYKIALAAQTIIPVSTGATTFYLLGERVGGSIRASDLELSLLFVPTAYGTVDPLAVSTRTAESGTALASSDAYDAPDATPGDIGRELAAMRAEINELRAQLAAPSGVGGASGTPLTAADSR